MPLIKEIMGRVIKDTRRDGDLILVRFAATKPGEKSAWVAVTPEFYRANMTCCFVPRREEPPES